MLKSQSHFEKNFINYSNLLTTMPSTIDSLNQELEHIRKDVEFIKDALSEKFELSDKAKKSLKEARKTPESKYVDLE
jgi:flagellar biosynthesis chaperone FliJ